MLYKAPEILFGDQCFGAQADVWSLGLVFCEMAGCSFHWQLKCNRYTTVDYMVATFQQLGTPDLTGLPHWPAEPPQFKRKGWPARVGGCIGNYGIALLDGLLEWMPSRRIRLVEASRHRYFQPELFALGGEPWIRGLAPTESFGPVFEGARHPWNVRVGQCAPEVLAWLQADPALIAGSAQHDAMDVDFCASRKNAKSEEARKFIVAGAIGSCSSTSMCSLDLDKPLPCMRVIAWHAAFCEANDHSLVDMGAAARQAIGRLPLADRGTNGEHFMDTVFSDWFLTCGELCIMNAGVASGPGAASSAGPAATAAPGPGAASSAPAAWEEAFHQDGGASILHMGLTLFGRRDVRFVQGDNLPDVAVRNTPGTVYFGGVTGAWHQVHHQASEPAELLHLPTLGACSATVMLRTALFPHNRARMRNTTPSPVCVFNALSKSFLTSCGRGDWRLPSLSECEQALEALPPAPLARAAKKESSAVAKAAKKDSSAAAKQKHAVRGRSRSRGPVRGPDKSRRP
jgi:hypothetical protein